MIGVKRQQAYRSQRFLFERFCSRSNMDNLARGADWRTVTDRKADQEQGIPAFAAWELLPGLRVTYTEDYVMGSSFAVAISYLGEESLRTPIAFLSAHPNTLSPEDLITDFDSSSTDPRKMSAAVVRLGLGAPLEEDERFSRRIIQCIGSSEADVRESAVWASMCSEWVGFRDELVRVAEGDDDLFLRELATEAVEKLDGIGADHP
ncbi:hypothetical protein [Streptomyces sp900116325]|uniref:hypothetical protein n=1 Tax=Streptomyces sp. 900116325 TaxID=3154295 RepID=UPI0033C33E5C